MTGIENFLFHSPSRGALRFDGVMRAIAEYMAKEPRGQYKIIVGTDSAARNITTLATVLIVHHVGHGAIYFFTKSPIKEFKTLRDRIFDEAMTSIMLAQELRSALNDAIGDTFFWDGNEIHVDIGENGPPRELIEAVSGIIKGYHFIPVIKPYAYGAFSVADRHTG